MADLEPGVQVLFGILALVVAFTAGYYWSAARYKLLTTSVAGLRGRVEPTAQEYKGLEAIVLSSLQDESSPEQTKLKEGTQAGTGDLGELVKTLSTGHGERVSASQLEIMPIAHQNVRPWHLFLTLADSFRDSNGLNMDAFSAPVCRESACLYSKLECGCYEPSGNGPRQSSPSRWA
jgi:hypothetical protein